MLNIQQNVPLAPYTTFHIGGPADYFVIVKTIDELKEAITWAKEKEIPFFILGTGANILVGDKGYRGLVIKNECNQFSVFSSQLSEKGQPVVGQSVTDQQKTDQPGSENRKPKTDNGTFLTAESGAIVDDIIKFTQEKGLSGFEHYAGIVSTVGGALWQNLHFLNPERTETMYIADILESAVILSSSSDSKGGVEKPQESSRVVSLPRTITVSKDYFQFGYDQSILHTKKDIVLSATFRLEKKDPQEMQKVITENLAWRREKHPKDAQHCSAGSIFKKIEHHGAGRLIEQVGLKGKQIGGAQISPVHANFIVNTGGASAKDVRDLIALAQQKVKDQLNLDLEPEISFVGEF